MQIPRLWFADSSKSLGLRCSGPPSPPVQTSVKKQFYGNEDEFWACTYRAVISAACVIQERDGVISDTGVFISPDEGWDEEDVARAQRFVAAKLPGGRITETHEDGDTRTVDLAAEESPDYSDEE